jgi:hypothetical protein
LLGEELAEFVVACFRDGRRSAPGIGTWPERAGFGAEAEVVGDTIDGDVEARSDAGLGTGTTIHGSDDTRAQLKGIGLHQQFLKEKQGNWVDDNDYSACTGFCKPL